MVEHPVVFLLVISLLNFLGSISDDVSISLYMFSRLCHLCVLIAALTLLVHSFMRMMRGCSGPGLPCCFERYQINFEDFFTELRRMAVLEVPS